MDSYCIMEMTFRTVIRIGHGKQEIDMWGYCIFRTASWQRKALDVTIWKNRPKLPETQR